MQVREKVCFVATGTRLCQALHALEASVSRKGIIDTISSAALWFGMAIGPQSRECR